MIYVHGLNLSHCTNKECDFAAKNNTYEEHCEKYPERALDTRDSWEKIPGLVELVSKNFPLAEETLAIGLHAIAVEERIEQGYLKREKSPVFDELEGETQDVYRVIARFIVKFFEPKR